MIEYDLTAAEEINTKLAVILGNNYTDDRRVTIPAAFCNLALDHHCAIILLFRNKLYGSGLALVRSIFEAMLRAHWIAGCATDAEVEQFAEDHSFDIMSRCDSDRIDKAFQTGGLFRQAKHDAWKAMNAYTHGGLSQLVRQFSGNRISAAYKEEDLLEGLRAATASVLLLGYLVAHVTAKPDKVAEIETLFTKAP
jgi:hypothetical protein